MKSRTIRFDHKVALGTHPHLISDLPECYLEENNADSAVRDAYKLKRRFKETFHMTSKEYGCGWYAGFSPNGILLTFDGHNGYKKNWGFFVKKKVFDQLLIEKGDKWDGHDIIKRWKRWIKKQESN